MIERLWNVLRGIFRGFVSSVEAANPEALLQNERENLRTQISRFNDGLVSHAAMCERLIGQVRQLESEETELGEKTRAHLRAGNREAAKQCAMRLQTVTRELVENRKQAADAERTYKDLVVARDVAVETARTKIERLRRSIDEMRVEKAMGELESMAAGLMSSIGSAGETLGRLEALVEEERSQARGLSRAARDQMGTAAAEGAALEQDALAEQALADFAAREGLVLDDAARSEAAGDAAPEATTKSMGPVRDEE